MGTACRNRDHRALWIVVQRNYNRSAFNGYRITRSAYSLVRCTAPGCNGTWRTRAAFVDTLPDSCTGCGQPAETSCRICRRPYCQTCLTTHHHEGYGTPATDDR
ncbi:hypothetical protein OHA46_33970 (plasmid) [Streptomyces sp. NBC_00708]